MSKPDHNSLESLPDVEKYLDQGPQADFDLLSEIVSWLEHLDPANSSERDVKVVQLLGTAAGKQWGDRRVWQDPFREHGILAIVLQNLDPSTKATSLTSQYLRVIGNSIAYNNPNREAALDHFAKIVSCLDRKDLIKTALAVLYNLGQDFDPANARAAEIRLDHIISGCLAEGGVPEEAIDFATTILNRTTEKLTPAQLNDGTSLAVFDNVLKTAVRYDEDHSLDYVALLVHYLQDPEFQQKAARPEIVEMLLRILLDFELNELAIEDVPVVMQELSTQTNPNETASDETSIILMVRLVNCVSALSASDAFVDNFELNSSVVQTLTARLTSIEVLPSTVCACVMLGNLATSDKVCIEMVQKLDLHRPLIKMLAERTEQALLFAAAGFIRHLTFPDSNRPILGGAGLIETCAHLLANQDPSIRGEAAAILCKLVTSCLPNIQKLVLHELPSSITLDSPPEIEFDHNPTYLDHIVRQALAPSAPLPSTTMKNPMIELGRTLIAILRYIRRPIAEGDELEIVKGLFRVPAVARPIARLVRQRFYADARSEGLLGLGLMAQTADGAACVVEELKADDGLLEAIKEFAGEQKGDTKSQKSDESAGRDYQNAVVLLHGLATNAGDRMDVSLRGDVEGLQAELSKLMVQD